MQISNKPYLIERILSATTYLTVGWVGFVWLVIATLLKKQIRPFLKYHIFQSLFISLLFIIISTLGNLIYIIIAKIPLLNIIPYLINMPIPLLFNLSLIQTSTTIIILYLVITSFGGYYSYLPWVSEIIKSNTGS